ncbi:hypothetical protein OH768_47835 [Streptomyces sp. NBC_01622]|uniref:hypothetical protein n=1 Tax=Streptomyces sp. NBC_01622 TaxID=2975903 RepID=UPI003865F372|nr:hypothetical protein OH768_47835 [Streptomyces sp. NBC_01622]
MKSDGQRELIPPDDTLRLIGALNAMKATFNDYAQQWQLLDESGHVPDKPSYTELLGHATSAQDLSRDVLRLTGEFAASLHSTNRAGRATLAHLAMASTLSVRATAYFLEASEAALGLQRSSSPTDQRYVKWRMVIGHASARDFLLRTSDSLRGAAKELDDHLDFQRFLSTLTPRQHPALPPPRPSGRHR